MAGTVSELEINRLLDPETISREVVEEIKHQVLGSIENRKVFDKKIESLEEKIKKEKDSVKLKDLKLLLGICTWIIGKTKEAVDLLSEIKTRKISSYYLGKCYQELGDYKNALECFERAKKSDEDEFDICMDIAETKRLAGDSNEALKIIKNFSQSHGDNAEFQYQWGHCLEAQGMYKEAMEHYERALQIDPNHAKSLFQMAFNYDMEGEDDSAIEYYERCVKLSPAYKNAYMNLGILYEDNGKYDDAIFCYEAVLDVEPVHERARFCLKSAKSSSEMFFDEETSKKQGQESEVLNIPISDFELSVRSRNCLEKMNIRTLKDLTRISEPELLTFKNFGETSLNEIKAILAQKGLQLGQSGEGNNNEKIFGKKTGASKKTKD
ncbi:MAG: tetratricopeptide repeat protein [Candidatus Kuenenia sp.]|nr:tetratricopeptide repeat protein [Candidatus Kuenenia hertensis]